MSKKDPLLGDEIPWRDHIEDDGAPAVILCKDNSVFATFAVIGVHPDTADVEQLISWFEQIHQAHKNIHADDISLFVHKCHGFADPELYPPAWHNGCALAEEIDAEYRANLFANTLYCNQIFLSVQVRSPNAAAQSIAQFFSEDASDPRPAITERVTRLNELCDLLQAQLSQFGLRRLGYVTRHDVIYDEIAEAYVFATTGLYRQIGATTGRMSYAMFSEDVACKYRHFEVTGPAHKIWGAILTFKDYPSSTAHWMLQPLDVAPYACTVVHSYHFFSLGRATAHVDRKQNKMFLAGDKAADQQEELKLAHNRLLNGEFVLGDYSMVQLVFAPSPRALKAVVNAAWRDFAHCGITALRVNRVVQAALLSIFPGNDWGRPRNAPINSINFGAFAPLYNWPEGNREGLWEGGEIALYRTLAGTPYRFHFQPKRQDGALMNGNTLMTGESGSGKSTHAGWLILMSAGRARVMGCDHKEGWANLFPAIGGQYRVLGDGEPVCAPLKRLLPTTANREFLTELWRGCIGGRLTEEEGRRLSLWLNTVWPALPYEHRNVREMRAIFNNDPEGVGARLDKWIWPTGELGWVLDAPEDQISLSDYCCYDTTKILNNKRALGPTVIYLFYQISLALDGRPLLVPFDEVWRIIDDEVFSPLLDHVGRTIRSKGGVLLFITQSPRDIRHSKIAHTLIEQFPNQIHMANPRGRREDYVEGFHFTDGEFDAFHVLQTGQGLFLLKTPDGAMTGQLDLRGLEHRRRILAAQEEDLREVEADEDILGYAQAAE